MGYKTQTITTNIERQKVYIVYKWQIDPYCSEREILRCFTSLKKAKEYVDKFTEDMMSKNMADEFVKERKGTAFQGTKDQFYKEVHYYTDEWHIGYFIIRIAAYELDAEYDETVLVRYNPNEEESE